MNDQDLILRWKLLLIWVFANAISFPLSWLLYTPIFPITKQLFGIVTGSIITTCIDNYRCTNAEILQDVFFIVFNLALSSLVIGLSQWIVLRLYLPRISICWLLTCSIGFSISVAIVFFYPGHTLLDIAKHGIIGGCLGGLFTGISQYLLLCKQVSLKNLCQFWTIMNSIGWGIGWTIAGIIGINAIEHMSAYGNSVMLSICFIAGSIIGSITGWMLLWCLRDPSKIENY